MAQLTFDELGGGEAPRTYTVSELVRQASRRLEARFASVWVEGEVSNLKTPASGHGYFTLKDARAQLAVVMFRAQLARLPFRIEDGQQLRCRGGLAIYGPQGRFQLTAEAAEPAGLGALQLAVEQLKRRLEAEGLFDPSRKKPLPRLPRTIAVVTSPTGAALRDIVRVLHTRCPVRVVVCPTPVQGTDAVSGIVRAMARADRLGADLIIVGRGGGSLEDLKAFNNEGVARAIFSARTPVISAVGHEVDLTIADLVADRRAPTPSAAAEMAVPVQEELCEQLRVHRARLGRLIHHRLQEGALRLERLERRLGTPLALVNRGRMALDEQVAALLGAMTRSVGARRQLLLRLQARLAAQEPRARLGRHRALLEERRRRLEGAVQRALGRRRSTLERLGARLEALGPLSVLERGFGLVLDENQRVINDVSKTAVGRRLVIRLARGQLRCLVEQVDPDP